MPRRSRRYNNLFQVLIELVSLALIATASAYSLSVEADALADVAFAF